MLMTFLIHMPWLRLG